MDTVRQVSQPRIEHAQGVMMSEQRAVAWRAGVIALAMTVCACGGGGGGGDGGPLPPPPPSPVAYESVQPPAAPAPEAINLAEASGVVVVSPDPLDAAGRLAGVTIELSEILPNGEIGSARASTATAADGGFRLAMPSGASTADGKWLITARAAGVVLRAYVHSGPMRIDVGSEALVRQIASSVGKLLVFPSASAATLKAISRSLTLYAGVNGLDFVGMSVDAAVNKIVQSLQRDHAMSYVLSTLASTGGLPASGVGDVGGFFAISASYSAMFVDGKGVQTIVTTRSQNNAPMSIDGTWAYRQIHYATANGQISAPISGEGGSFRTTPGRLIGTVPASTANEVLLSNLIGEFALQSFPLQTGDRQLDARRITATMLNFTGGTDEQPISFSSIERVAGVELINSTAGPIRAVKLVNELEIGLPTASGRVSRLTARGTTWLVPGAGTVKALDQLLVDGVLDTSSPDETHALQQAWANSEVWPNRVTLKPNPIWANAASGRCRTWIAGTRRFVTVEYGPLKGGSPTLALALWDMDSGAQIGVTRNFAGFAGDCPVVAGQTASVLVTETFLDRQAATVWPAGQASAVAASDVIHQVSAADLQDLNSYVLPAVPDPLQPAQYWPGVARYVNGAPDSTSAFVVGMTQSDNVDWSRHPQFVQVFRPNATSPLVSLGRVQITLADWTAGRLFTRENFDPATLRFTPFSINGANTAATVVVKTNFRDNAGWFANASHLFLNDGKSIRLSDGSDGPALGFDRDKCGLGAGELVCLDWRNDRLARFDSATGLPRSFVPLGSYLRSLAVSGSDFSTQVNNLGGINVFSPTGFTVGAFDVQVGRW